MAFSRAPTIDTYSSQRIPMVQDIHVRRLTQANSLSTVITDDAGMVNLLPFKLGDEIVTETRSPIVASTTLSGNIRGLHVWEKTAGTIYYFVVTGTNVRTSTDGVNFTTVTTLLTGATTPVRFTEFIDSTNTKKLVLVDGVEGYVFTSNAAGTKITDVDFPTPHVPFPVFLDGYLFLAKANTGDIYSSDLDDPAIWTAGSFLSSEMYPDDIQALVKVNNYLVAIGTQSCEYFYDAGVATASPLARIDGASLPFGTLFPNSIAINKDTFVMIANNNDGQGTLIRVTGQKYEILDAKFILTLFNSKTLSVAGGNAMGCFIRQQSTLFYILAFRNGVTSNARGQQPTFAYSFEAKMWSEMACASSATNDLSYPVEFSAPGTTTAAVTFVAGNTGLSSSYIGTLSESTANDNIFAVATGTVKWELRTDFLDFGTLNVKTMSRLGLAFEAPKVLVFDTSIAVYAISDDTVAFSNTWVLMGNIVVPLNTSITRENALAFPFITQLGKFRRRAFKFNGDGFYRLHFCEVDINKGVK